ncbi:hypothetical protein [Rhodococcus artemisiae]|uniref:Uncharacterized protein n=1 Tax=Rhodococcus artemisiae TaxID=714159 RepID=A0ABU7L5Q2_9NOCA|nr:hypothetical protein [Rhodococcus artemisiae]MEE2056609.1 hypothetical protein [Rhodococcus artemisiae]
MNGDGLDLDNPTDRALYDADRVLIAQLIAGDANPDDEQWQHELLQNVSAYRNALAGVQKGGGTLQLFTSPITGGDEIVAKPGVGALIEEHRRILEMVSADSISTSALISGARTYVTRVSDVRNNTNLEVSTYPALGTIEISGGS